MIAEASGAEISPDGGAEAASQFDDVAADAWYTAYVAWAAEEGVIQGVTSSEFRPQDPVTRQDMAVIICRCADACGIVLSQDEPQIVFSDAEEISLYARDAANRLQRAGIIDGRDGRQLCAGADSHQGGGLQDYGRALWNRWESEI